MKRGMMRFVVMLLAVMMIIVNAVPAFAATESNSAGGYSVPAAITIQVGEKKKFNVTEPKGRFANVSFQYVPTYVSTSGYSAGAYWGRPAEITFMGKEPGTFTAIATVDVHRKPGVPNSSFAKYNLYCKVTVVNKKKTTTPSAPAVPSAKKIALRKIILNRTSLSVNVGDTPKLSVSYSPSNTTDSRSVIWTSSNSGVASVSGGRVKAKKPGTATITAKVGKKTATCRITVKAVSSGKSSSSGSSKTSGKSSPSGSSKASAGSYKSVADAYTLLNKFRTTKSNQWYWSANNKSKVTTYGLKGLRRDAALEKVAKTRAKEAWTMYYEKGRATHNRPNGKSCFTAYPSGMTYLGENLAWGHATSNAVILDPNWGWAETNAGYAGQGHRRNMLNSRFTKVGIACYVKDGKTCWAMCLGN